MDFDESGCVETGPLDAGAGRVCSYPYRQLDYRSVAGVKMAFKKVASQTYMQMTIKLTDVQPDGDRRGTLLSAATLASHKGTS